MVLRTRAHDGAAAFSSRFNVKTQENLIISANLIRIVRRISRPLCSCQSLRSKNTLSWEEFVPCCEGERIHGSESLARTEHLPRTCKDWSSVRDVCEYLNPSISKSSLEYQSWAGKTVQWAKVLTAKPAT